MEIITKIKIALVGVAVFLTYRLGNLATPLVLLFCMMLLDYITAIGASDKRGQKIASDIGISGIKKKIFMLVLVALGIAIEVLISFSMKILGLNVGFSAPISIIICLWLIVNEMISILENIKDVLGDNAVPKWLDAILKRFKSKIDDSVEEDGHR